MKTFYSLTIAISLVFVGQSQTFWLNNDSFTDTLYLNDYYEANCMLTNISATSIVIRSSFIVNTIDTTNWVVTYCTYPDCLTQIPETHESDTIKPGEKVLISALSISNTNSTLNSDLIVRLEDLSNPGSIDSVKFNVIGMNKERPGKSENPGSTGVLSASDEANGFNIFPNPISGGSFSIGGIDEITEIHIFNSDGSMVRTLKFDGSPDVGVKDVNLNPGYYFFEAFDRNGHIASRKIIVK